MRKSKLVTLIISVAMAASMVLTSCSGGNSTASGLYPGTIDENQVTINLGSEPPKMNSLLTTDTTSFTVLRHTNEGLTTLDKENVEAPGMAEKWDISEDKLTYTFHLRDGIKWQDGSPVTAADFKYAWMTLLDPKTAAEYNYMGFIFKNGQAYNTKKAKAEDVAIKVIDEKTLEFTLESPVPYILSLLSFGTFLPVKEGSFSDKYATEASNIICNGPYIMTEWNHDDYIMLEKNPEYYAADEVKIEKIKMMMITETSTALNSFQSNEIDMIGLTGDQALMLAEEGQKLQQYSDGSGWDLAFNLDNEKLANKDLREALTKALDRETFIKNVLKNNSEVAFNWTPSFMNNGTKKFLDGIKPTFKDNDVDGAQAALEKAKATLGDNIKIEILTDDGDQAKLQAAYYQECWKKIGIEATVKSVPFKDRLARQQSGDYEVSIYGWGPDYNDPLTFLDLWTSDSGNNIINLNSATYDANIAIARTTADFEERTKALVACEAELMDNYYLGPIYYRMRDFVTSDKLAGVVRTPFQDINLRWTSISK